MGLQWELEQWQELGKSFIFPSSESLEQFNNRHSENHLSVTELHVMALCRKYSSALKVNIHQGPDVATFMEHYIPEEAFLIFCLCCVEHNSPLYLRFHYNNYFTAGSTNCL